MHVLADARVQVLKQAYAHARMRVHLCKCMFGECAWQPACLRAIGVCASASSMSDDTLAKHHASMVESIGQCSLKRCAATRVAAAAAAAA
eukprot:10689249-Lingulodinium_polyedra.AAC.1